MIFAAIIHYYHINYCITRVATVVRKGTETEFFPEWKHDIDENEIDLPRI